MWLQLSSCPRQDYFLLWFWCWNISSWVSVRCLGKKDIHSLVLSPDSHKWDGHLLHALLLLLHHHVVAGGCVCYCKLHCCLCVECRAGHWFELLTLETLGKNLLFFREMESCLWCGDDVHLACWKRSCSSCSINFSKLENNFPGLN